MDWTTLVGNKVTAGSIKNWANDSRPDSQTILDEAVSWISRRLRARQMLTSTEGTATASSSAIALPSNFMESKVLRWTGVNSGQVRKVRIETLEENIFYDGDGSRITGQPRLYAPIGTEARFDVVTDTSYTFRLVYYGEITPLGTGSGSATSNFLCTRYPTLLRYACMAGVAGFVKNDQDRQYWEAKAAAEIQRINLEQEREMLDGNVDLTPVVI